MSRLPDFRLETYFSTWEFKARHHMTASDAQTLGLRELLQLAGDSEREAWEQLSLGYSETWGMPALREAIAVLPASIAQPMLIGLDTLAVRLAPRRDGLRWIDVADPSSRKADKLQVTGK